MILKQISGNASAGLNECSGPSIHSDSLKVVVMYCIISFPLHVMFVLSWSLGSILLHHNNMGIIQTYKLVLTTTQASQHLSALLQREKSVPKDTWQFFVQSWPLPAFKLVHILSLTHSLLFGCSFDAVNILQNSHRLLKGLIKWQRRRKMSKSAL